MSKKSFGGPFSDALLGAISGLSELSPIEVRIILIATKLINDAAMQQRFNKMVPAPPGETAALPPLTAEMYSDAVEAAIRAAIAIEKPLRDLRDALTEKPQA